MFLKSTLLSVAVVTIFSTAAFAADTNEIRLDQSDGPLFKMSITNQGNIGLCYSYAMVQAASAELIKNGKFDPREMTSPYLASIESKNLFLLNLLRLNSSIDGGWSCRTFRRSVKKNGTCSTQNIEGRFYSSNHFGNISDTTVVSTAHDELKSIYRTNRKKPAEALALAQDFMQDVYPDAKALTTKHYSSFFKERTANNFSAKMLATQCQNRVSMKEYKCKSDLILFHGDLGMKRTKEKIEKALKKKTPPMFSYCSGILSNGVGYRGLLRSDCGMHASIIVGQKTDSNKKLQYLVRNSWGATCANHSKDWTCENNQLWVDARELILNMQTLDIISK